MSKPIKTKKNCVEKTKRTDAFKHPRRCIVCSVTKDAEAKALRASLKVTREEQQPKRVMALHAARATRELILEVKRVKQIIKRRSAT